MDLLVTLQRLKCWLGFHDFRVLEISFGFGEAGDVEKVECKQCGLIISREKARE
ncbi:MAG: hypothetical protein HN377_01495 [Alphaproteobacteria bacterium]|jgi:hypothetical protein|nr:hypothetical protein [Alphaproteobacteria bacterium]MBT7943856.1 hypothetical protein [Alphaproteobacteria bacterium]